MGWKAEINKHLNIPLFTHICRSCYCKEEIFILYPKLLGHQSITVTALIQKFLIIQKDEAMEAIGKNQCIIYIYKSYIDSNTINKGKDQSLSTDTGSPRQSNPAIYHAHILYVPYPLGSIRIVKKVPSSGNLIKVKTTVLRLTPFKRAGGFVFTLC